ncbi:MAG: GntR family transcriptional regulator [bacterium]|nr:GntR family transcriptional regulator [bacterium]
MLRELDDWDFLPIYAKIAEMLRNEIKSGKFKPGAKLPTEEELCRLYNVSRGTIQKALNLLVSEGIISRRRGMGSFVRENSIKISNKSIGLILPYMKYMGSDLLLGIENAVRKQGYHLLFFSSDADVELEIYIINRLVSSDIDGIILYTLQGDYEDRGVKTLLNSRKPFVLIDRYLPHLDTSWVVSDNYNGGYEMTEYLIRQGHRKIGFVIYSEEYYEVTSVKDRKLGYLNAMERYELSPIVIESYPPMPPKNKVEIKESFSDLIDKILEKIKEENLTALFGINDMTSLRIMRALTDLGYKIPDDISIVGFDSLKIFKDIGIHLTSVYQDFFKMGFEAGRLILEKINNPNLADKRISIPIEIKEGETVKPLRKEVVSEKVGKII